MRNKREKAQRRLFSQIAPPKENPWVMLLLGQIFTLGLPVVTFYSYKNRLLTQLYRVFDQNVVFTNKLGYPVGGIIHGGRQIEKLNTLLQGILWWMIIAVTVFIVYAVYYYRVYYQRHAVYLMKRVPDRFEMHRRCLTVPIILTVEAIIIAVILVLYCKYLYYRYTPEMYLPANGTINLWRLFTL